MECQFCIEFAELQTCKRVIAKAGEWVLLPTLGCFTPGYCLFMPVRHIDAAADVTPKALVELQAEVENMREAITSAFGPTIIAEHGPWGCQMGASCCSHAHLHLIPVPNPDAVTAAYRAKGGPGNALRGLADLAEVVNGPYLYLSPRLDEHWLWPARGFARQYVRRVCASLHGKGEYFDWRDHPFTAIQAHTISVLRATLESPAA
jgi:diadenosine tetraphosphate (Ap4A) HIT family hydrolase